MSKKHNLCSIDMPHAALRHHIPSSHDIHSEEAAPSNDYSTLHKTLQARFTKDFVRQNSRMLNMAGYLLLLQLAITGVFAAIVQFTANYNDLVTNMMTCAAFLCLLCALGFSLTVLKPSRYQVDRLLKNSQARRHSLGESTKDHAVDLHNYYRRSAENKFHALSYSTFFTFLGMGLMVANVIVF